jgi:hypothetical protein
MAMSKDVTIHWRRSGRLACETVQDWRKDVSVTTTTVKQLVNCARCRKLFGTELA